MKLDIRSLVTAPSFWYVILLGLVVQAVPFVLTLGAPAADSNTVVGFPFAFVSYGGMCGSTLGQMGQCPRSFIPLHIFFDTAVIVGAAAGVAWYRGRRENASAL